MGTFSFSLYILYLLSGLTHVQSTTLPAPGQPTKQAALGTFNIIGSSLVSAQQVRVLFMIRDPTIYAKFLSIASCFSGHSIRFTS